MAVKYQNLVIQFNPSSVTAAQLTTQLNIYAEQGWRFVTAMQNTTSKAFALFIKELTE
jgi:hypothetical protein